MVSDPGMNDHFDSGKDFQCQRLAFVSGTGTGVGKTYVTAGVVRALRRRGVLAFAVKPVETGVLTPPGSDSDSAILSRAAGLPLGIGNVYALPRPVSPHLAARDAGIRIDEKQIYERLTQVSRCGTHMLIEGAGGLRVPLREGYEVLDFIGAMSVPVLLVGQAGLGGINQALLSLEALSRRGILVLGLVLSEVEPADQVVVTENYLYLKEHSGVPVLGVVPHGAATLDEHLDLVTLIERWAEYWPV